VILSKEAHLLRPIILDLGSNITRIGWAGEDEPEIIVPSVYCDTKDFLFETEVIEGLKEIFYSEQVESRRYLFGEEALNYQNILKIHEFKKEENYFVLQNFFTYYYRKLGIPKDYQLKQPVIVITPYYMTEFEKAKIQQMLFDLNFPMVLFVSESQAILSTLQKSSGVIVNIGESKTYISSYLHGFSNIMARDMYPVAGNELTLYFLNLILSGKGAGKNLYIDYWVAKDLKEKVAICIDNVDVEKQKIKDGLKDYNQLINFPDGSTLEINFERFMIPEPLFQPRLIHIDYMNLPEAIARIIKSWDRENWEELVSNIILTGGGTLIPGIKERLTKELANHFSDKIIQAIKFIAAKGREHMSWIGASILHSQGKLDQGWNLNPNYSPTPAE